MVSSYLGKIWFSSNVSEKQAGIFCSCIYVLMNVSKDEYYIIQALLSQSEHLYSLQLNLYKHLLGFIKNKMDSYAACWQSPETLSAPRLRLHIVGDHNSQHRSELRWSLC